MCKVNPNVLISKLLNPISFFKFQVKNLEEYSFRPGNVVSDISSIYINFAEFNSFLSAVSKDGRSYSPGLVLFTQTIFSNFMESRLEVFFTRIQGYKHEELNLFLLSKISISQLVISNIRFQLSMLILVLLLLSGF